MRDVREIMRDRQRDIRQELDQRGILLKQVHFKSGLSEDTLRSYFCTGERVPAIIPTSALYMLIEKRALPLDLLNLLVPAGYALVRIPEELDHDEIEQLARDYLAAKGATHHPESEAGRDIGPTEKANLDSKAVSLRAAA